MNENSSRRKNGNWANWIKEINVAGPKSLQYLGYQENV